MGVQVTALLSRLGITEAMMASLCERSEQLEFGAGQSADFALINPLEIDEADNHIELGELKQAC